MSFNSQYKSQFPSIPGLSSEASSSWFQKIPLGSASVSATALLNLYWNIFNEIFFGPKYVYWLAWEPGPPPEEWDSSPPWKLQRGVDWFVACRELDKKRSWRQDLSSSSTGYCIKYRSQPSLSYNENEVHHWDGWFFFICCLGYIWQIVNK